MRNLIVRGCTLLMILGLVGCGGSEREGLISETLAQLNRATSVLGNIKDGVQTALKKAEEEKRAPNSADFDKVVKEIIPELKEVGGKMQMLKRQTEALREGVTEEQRKALADRFSKQTQQAYASLRDEQDALHRVMQRATSASEEAVKDLKKNLAEAQGEFEIIAKLR